MKNTLTIKVGDAENPCYCECLDSVYDGENSIVLVLNVPSDTDPKLEIYEFNRWNKTIPLTAGKVQTIILLSDGGFDKWKDTQMQFQYTSNERSGSTFYINFSESNEGNLMLKRVDDNMWNAQFTSYSNSGSGGCECDKYELPPATTTTLGGVIVGENIEVEADGTISCKKMTQLEEDMEKLFQSVSDGKKEIASAITDKGISTESDATFSKMAENISKIETGVDTSEYVDFPASGYENYVVMTCTGKEFIELVKQVSNSKATYDSTDTYFIGIRFTDKEPASSYSSKITGFSDSLHCICVGNASMSLYDVWNPSTYESELVIYAPNTEKIFAPIDCDYMFSGLRNMEGEIDLSWLDTRITMSMTSMFEGFGRDALTKLTLGSSFYTHNVHFMSSMFSACGGYEMTELILGKHFDTSKVTNMFAMFMDCGTSKMTELDLGDKFKIQKKDVIGAGGNLFHRNEYYPLTIYCTQDTANKLAGISNVTAVVKY